MSNVKDFLKRKDIVITPQRYLIEALGAMAQGLFASLLIGTIIKTLGQQTGLDVLVDLGGYATAMSGPAMACAIGWALHCPPLVLFSLITVGYSANALGGAGGPLAVLIIAIVASELGKAVSKETRVDILVTPLVTIFSGVGLSMLIAAPIGAAASQVGTLIMWATEQAPLVMGILVSVIVGVALTLPISSAAICAALGLTGLAGGAAVAGCCAQMIGFAVMSYKENGVGGLVSQGLGTSMLQMGNIVKNPRIWIAPTLASAITGPLATCVFHFAVLIVMAAAAVFLFRTRSYKVEGNSYYGERTITTWIENDPLSVNSLYVLYKYNFTDADLPSGVESLSISLKDPWTVKVKVKEKEMAGYVDYDGAYLYFDRTGTAVLRTKKIIEGVPHIEGLMFDSAKAKIGKKLPVEDDSIFEKIVEVSKNLKKYNLTPDRMGCTDGGVQIYFEIVQVSLGNGNYEEKLRQVEPILKKLTELYPGKAGVLHLENYDAESESIPFVPAA